MSMGVMFLRLRSMMLLGRRMMAMGLLGRMLVNMARCFSFIQDGGSCVLALIISPGRCSIESDDTAGKRMLVNQLIFFVDRLIVDQN